MYDKDSVNWLVWHHCVIALTVVVLPSAPHFRMGQNRREMDVSTDMTYMSKTMVQMPCQYLMRWRL